MSQETIYRSLFVQSRGALKQEPTGYLRTRRVMRRPRGANKFKPRRHRDRTQRTPSQDARVHDTIREVNRGCCVDPLRPHAKDRIR